MTKTPAFPSSLPSSDITAVLMLSDGSFFWGYGIGAVGSTIGEICFNTAMTGYQEILTDPSYAEQIITFTFPHIGNVGTNKDDHEALSPACKGLIIKEEVTEPSSFRSQNHLCDWLSHNKLIGICGVDTRKITHLIRENGAMTAIIAHWDKKIPDFKALAEKISSWPGLEGMDLAKQVSCKAPYHWHDASWSLKDGYNIISDAELASRPHVVAIDYGIKRNILRRLTIAGARVTVVPATATFDEIIQLKPDGIFLSNGPGDPAATGEYALPVIHKLIKTKLPIFGICLGHQLIALAFGGKTYKMHQGHRGANHPVKDLRSGKVEITSMNHGFSVDKDSLPENVSVSHISLFDQTVCGLEVKDKPVFSVQHHPEASPGPQDSFYLFEQFIDLINSHNSRSQTEGKTVA